ncbi:MAG: hypothetical protein SWI22_05090 [Pseudomonadota bacterium]|nr:hypothetical protein [Pseudomonadota bacterium]
MSERKLSDSRVSGVLLMAAGAMWFLAAWLGDQIAFYGVGAMFVMLGVAAMSRARRAGR